MLIVFSLLLTSSILQQVSLAFTPAAVSLTGLSSSTPIAARRIIVARHQFPDLVSNPVEAWDAYNQALEASPLIVKSVTASIILGSADLAGQALERKRAVVDGGSGVNNGSISSIDWARCARFAFFGLVLQAPWNHFYYLLLDGQIPPTEDPFSATNIEKVMIDQFVQAPIFTVLIFVFLGFLEGKNTESIKSQLQKDYKNTMLANCECL